MKQFTLIASLVLVAALAGCAADMSPNPGLGDPYPAPLNDPQITVINNDLWQWLGFHPAIVTRERGRNMEVEQPVRNLSDKQYLIEYRIIFFDDRGRELTPVMGWEFAALDPKQTVRLKRKAMSADAENYKLEVRWAR